VRALEAPGRCLESAGVLFGVVRIGVARGPERRHAPGVLQLQLQLQLRWLGLLGRRKLGSLRQRRDGRHADADADAHTRG
jgi:hypothetical protein